MAIIISSACHRIRTMGFPRLIFCASDRLYLAAAMPKLIVWGEDRKSVV